MHGNLFESYIVAPTAILLKDTVRDASTLLLETKDSRKLIVR